MKKRIIACIVALVMLIVQLGCTQSGGNQTVNNTIAPSATTSNDSSNNNTLSSSSSASTTSTETDETGNYPSYINLESHLPIVKTGENYTLSVAFVSVDTAIDWKDMWYTHYFKEYMNLNFDAIQLMQTGLAERKNLMLASGDMPDIMMSMAFTPAEILKYGQLEHQFLALDTYIDETLTPDICYMFDIRPDGKQKCTTPDGHLYTLPSYGMENDEGLPPRLMINTAWLDSCGLQTPRTLDELITALRTVKEKDPENVGSENIVPMGGGYETSNPGFYILNALGYVLERGDYSYGSLPCVRNGQAEIPCGNPETYREYIRIMKMLFDEGLLSEQFFVLDSTGIQAQLGNHYIALYPDTVHRVLSTLDEWKMWNAIYPLTSDFNPTPTWYKPVADKIGGVAVSANTKYPELSMRFINAFFAKDARLYWSGPPEGTPEALGFMTPHLNPDDPTTTTYGDDAKFPEGMASDYQYATSYLMWTSIAFGCVGWRDFWRYMMTDIYHGQDPGPFEPYSDDTNQRYRLTMRTNVMPYVTDGFPIDYYLDETTAVKLTDLKAVIDPFVREQLALFITGSRSLDDFDNYLRELDSIGFQEYEQIFKDIWAVSH